MHPSVDTCPELYDTQSPVLVVECQRAEQSAMQRHAECPFGLLKSTRFHAPPHSCAMYVCVSTRMCIARALGWGVAAHLGRLSYNQQPGSKRMLVVAALHFTTVSLVYCLPYHY